MTEEIKKLTIEYDKKTPNTVEFIIHDESHTLANMITERFLKDQRCTFSAYKIVHPLDNNVHIRVTAIRSINVKSLIIEILKSFETEINELCEQFVNLEKNI
ncbi:putative subunit Rpb11 of DNA-directed RNA polymerase II [Hamiltosporidium tvaerminnensis]|uniref:Putative subunit Rpb11 of DNA-directed RNA polymerase II n=1 Tax=Hamiltosporidium tvaerminnensis TaxID=1176355 RepID=A0A4Q9LQ23_9MICR|nr:DNA-directed RNA polymerase II core subunit [Hamiltosporidium tvaerminnensis]TBT99297.1 putative subunit Rpb11 of DNA-directed RNA polymerase II [Hamiltosporidium tvaerminnensis]TBU10528.1 putative subunit Rpb11 of DNA-directed RNA polymerase II [Hamiltosporidium tvaerminnensis]